MKKKLFILCLTVFAIAIVCIVIIKYKTSCHLVNWNGNFIEFFVRNQQPKLGLLNAPSTMQEAEEKHLITPGQINLDKRGGKFLVPEMAWFSDIEEFGAVFYKNNSENALYACDVYFFKETSDQFMELYRKIRLALEKGFGDFGGGNVTGSCGVEFVSQINSVREFPVGFQVEANTWSELENRWGIVVSDFFEITDGFFGIEGWDEGYVIGVNIVWLK